MITKHKASGEISIMFTRKQLELIEKALDEYRKVFVSGSRGTPFAAWRRVRRALGTWREIES